MEVNKPEKHVCDTIFVVSWLFMGVISTWKYVAPTFQCQIVKNVCILTDNESDDKVVFDYVQKLEAVKQSGKGSTPLGYFSKQWL